MLKANSYSELKSFLNETIDKSGFELEEVDFSNQDEWFIKDGVISHKSGGFFHISGFRSSNGKEDLVLYQPQGAYNGMLLRFIDKRIHLLLQARWSLAILV